MQPPSPTKTHCTGTKKRTYVRAGGEEIAWQNGDSGGSVVFQAADPAGMSLRSAEPNGDIFDAQGSESSPAELDPLGNNVGQETPFQIISGGSTCVGCGMLDETMPQWAAGGHPRSTLNGFPISHEEAHSLIDTGAAIPYQLQHLMSREGYRINSFGFGLFSITTTTSGIINAPPPPGTVDDGATAYATFDQTETRYFRMPLNNDSNQAKCDNRLARIFGGPDTVMATKWDIKGIVPGASGSPERRAPGVDREFGDTPEPGAEDPRSGTVHLYSNADGTQVDVPNAFTPPGWKNIISDIASTGNVLRIYYEPGSLAKYGYLGGLTVNFTHIGPTDSKGRPVKPRRNGPKNSMGSVQVGVLGGGPGTDPEQTKGSNNGYWVHSHMIFNTWDGANSPINWNTRVDPRTIFCRDLGFK